MSTAKSDEGLRSVNAHERLNRAADLIEQRAAAAPAEWWKNPHLRASLVPWVALMGPDIAAPLAAWLRVTADRAEQYALGHLACDEPLALAAAILGEVDQ